MGKKLCSFYENRTFRRNTTKMAISYNTKSFLFILLVLLLVPINHSLNSEDLVSELINLQSQSPTGVIQLSNRLLWRILSVPVPRPFTLLVLFDSQKVHSDSEMSLPTLSNEFSVLSSSFHTNNPDNSNKLFFVDIEFQEASQASFVLFGVKSLPHICLVHPFATDFERDCIQMESSDFSGNAESMAEFVEAKSKHTVGPIHRSGFIIQKMSMIALGIVTSLFLVKKIVSGNTLLHDKNTWMVGSIFVYLFSVSGTMYTIINKIPLALVDRDDPGKLVFFYYGSGGQLGAEGLTVGFLYTIFGLLLAFVTHVLVHVKNRNIQRLVMLLAVFVSSWAVKKVFYLYNWKAEFGHIYE